MLLNSEISALYHGHRYSFATNTNSIKEEVFLTRQAANDYMYEVAQKNNLVIDHVLDDNHDKTYVCTNGVRFYIQRLDK